MIETDNRLPVRLEACAHSPRQQECMTLPDLQVQSEWGTVELVDKIAEEWRQLCQEGPCNEPFFRPEWIAAAIRAFAGQQRLLLVTARNGARLRAVLPLLEQKGWAGAMPCTRLRSASRIPRFDFVLGDGPDIADAVRAAWQHLRSLPGWDVIELVNVPQGGAAERLLAVAEQDAFPTWRHEYARSPYIALNGQQPGEDFSRFGRSSRFRYHLRQGWRDLAKLGPIRLQRTQKADPETLQRFYRLEQSGWKGKEGTAIASKRALRQFYDIVARGAEQFGYLSMHFLEQGDATVAAHLGLTYGGRYYPIKVAYDENFSEYGPGHLIIGRVLQDCVERGLSEFDCLGEWTEAKAKWTATARSHISCSIFRKSAAGHILRAETRLQHKLNQALLRVVRSVTAAAHSYVARQKSRGSRGALGSGPGNKA